MKEIQEIIKKSFYQHHFLLLFVSDIINIISNKASKSYYCLQQNNAAPLDAQVYNA